MTSMTGFETLSALVQVSSSSGVQRRALLLRTDRLPPSLSRPEHLRQARLALDPLATADRGHRHELPGGRLAFSWRGDAPRQLGQALDGLNRLLQDNPLDAPSLQQLVGIYELPDDGAVLLEEASAGLPDPSEVAAEVEPTPVLAPPLQPLDPAELDRLEHSLASTDMSRFARRRPVSHYSSQGMQLAWEERTLSIPELIETVAPGRDARADVWLFRRLTRVLDRRMLSILSGTGELRGAGPFSITLNVASVLSQEFLRFDAVLPTNLRNRVVLGFLPADIASDTAAFAFARNFARERAYRVCLRAVSAALLPALDLPALDLDFIQLIWSADIAALTKLPASGRARWIVGQPCTAEAIEWGVAHDLSLFATKPTM